MLQRRRTASRSSRTTRIIRPRSGRCSRACASARRDGSWWFSSRTGSAAPRSSRRNSPPRWAWPTGFSCSTSIRRARRPSPGGTTADFTPRSSNPARPCPSTYLPGRDPASSAARCARRCSRGTGWPLSGPGDIDQLAHELAAQRGGGFSGGGGLGPVRRRAPAAAVRRDPADPRRAAGAEDDDAHRRVRARLLRAGGNRRSADCCCARRGRAGLPRLLPRPRLQPDRARRGRGRAGGLPGASGLAGLRAAARRPHLGGRGAAAEELCAASPAGRAWPGFEFLEGIPGSVGGALRMNAGAMGGWIFDVVEEVQLMTPRAARSRTLRKSGLRVAYRECARPARGHRARRAARAGGAGRRARPSAARSTSTGASATKSQPREPSAGCVFKNPPGASAGKLIDELGLKGERVGDAEVSPVHANFIINRGQATSADIIALMRRVRERVQQARGITLEPEVLLLRQGMEGRAVNLLEIGAGCANKNRCPGLGSAGGAGPDSRLEPGEPAPHAVEPGRPSPSVVSPPTSDEPACHHSAAFALLEGYPPGGQPARDVEGGTPAADVRGPEIRRRCARSCSAELAAAIEVYLTVGEQSGAAQGSRRKPSRSNRSFSPPTACSTGPGSTRRWRFRKTPA